MTLQPPRFVGLDDMVKALSLRWLNDHGYINCTVNQRDPDFSKDLKYRTTATHLRLRDQWDPNMPHIIPALRRHKWNLSDEMDWVAILPSVELASRILDDVAILPFFTGMLQDVPFDRDSKQFDIDAPTPPTADPTTCNVTQTFIMLTDAWERIFLNFAEYEQQIFARTNSHLYGGGCTISFNAHFLPILRGDAGWGVEGYSIPWTPGTDEASARFRTQIILATTIVHEFAHATYRLFKQENSCPEPYLRDRPLNEVGFELENYVVGGMITDIDGGFLHAPYGFVIHRWPCLMTCRLVQPKVRSKVRGDAEAWGLRWSTRYPIHMDWCQKLFTKALWDEQVTRYGFSALRPERRIGYRQWDPTQLPTHTSNMSAADVQARQAINHAFLPMKLAIQRDAFDTSDEEDAGDDDIVTRGSKKLRDAQQQDTQMVDADSDLDINSDYASNQDSEDNRLDKLYNAFQTFAQ